MLASISRILPLTLVRRERILSVPGRILVRKGQRVGATDAIGEYNLRQDFHLIDVRRVLGISSARADEYIQCETGQKVAEGDIIAGPAGFTRKLIRSPRSGKVILAGGGQVLIEFDEKPIIVKAGFSGEIAEIISDRGVIVETAGALIQGVWGNGRIDAGVLVNPSSIQNDELTAQKLDISSQGAIVLAGFCKNEKVLELADQLSIRGLILGSLAAALKNMAERLRFPVILLEGFGSQGINPSTYKLLVSHEKREVSINAEKVDRFKGNYPEIVIPLPAEGVLSQPSTVEYLSLAQKVRLLNNPYYRMTGKVSRLPGLSIFPNGVRAQSAEVILDHNGEKVLVPADNLEVMV